jgi:hypothetical protein
MIQNLQALKRLVSYTEKRGRVGVNSYNIYLHIWGWGGWVLHASYICPIHQGKYCYVLHIDPGLGEKYFMLAFTALRFRDSILIKQLIQYAS